MYLGFCKSHLHIVSFELRPSLCSTLTGGRHPGPPKHAALVVRRAHGPPHEHRTLFGGDHDRANGAMLADLAALRNSKEEVGDGRH